MHGRGRAICRNVEAALNVRATSSRLVRSDDISGAVEHVGAICLSIIWFPPSRTLDIVVIDKSLLHATARRETLVGFARMTIIPVNGVLETEQHPSPRDAVVAKPSCSIGSFCSMCVLHRRVY